MFPDFRKEVLCSMYQVLGFRFRDFEARHLVHSTRLSDDVFQRLEQSLVDRVGQLHGAIPFQHQEAPFAGGSEFP
jgi:hypothetical protein